MKTSLNICVCVCVSHSIYFHWNYEPNPIKTLHKTNRERVWHEFQTGLTTNKLRVSISLQMLKDFKSNWFVCMKTFLIKCIFVIFFILIWPDCYIVFTIPMRHATGKFQRSGETCKSKNKTKKTPKGRVRLDG